MSRRKQSNPARHLDGENDNRKRRRLIYVDLREFTGSLPMFSTEPPPPSLDPDGAVPEGEVDRSQDQPPNNEDYLEPVICVNCQQEFCSQWALMAHEKACCALTMNSEQYDLQGKIDMGASGSTPAPGGGGEMEGEEEEDVEDPGVSQEELMSRVDGGEMMVGEEGEEEMEEEGEGGAPSDQEDYLGVPLSMTGAVAGRDGGYPFLPPGVGEPGKSEENKENNSGLSNQTEEGEDAEPSNGEVVSGFNPAVAAASLSGMFSGNNVTLEPMSATKAAVAQFPLSQSQLTEDSSSMNAEKALEELKRKDMMNQQIIRHMQLALLKHGMNMSEVMAGVFGMSAQAPGMPLPPAGLDMASVMMGPHSMADYLSSQAAKLQKEEAKAMKEEAEEEEEGVKDLPKDLSKDIEQAVKQVDREFSSDPPKLKTEFPSTESKLPSSSSSSSASSSSTVSSMSSYLSSLTPTTPLSAVTSSSLSALSSMTHNSGLGGSSGGPSGGSSGKQDGGRSSSGGNPQYSSSSLTALQRETDALKSAILPQLHMPMTAEAYRGYCQRGTILERAQYACDDPFFKHKCRFCHKVFGSDSALQIHVRSHTGERPFKCNICGNRFSTKGNLKVHFERHKAKYPHIKMNPNPVPESFDRLPPLVPPAMSSPTPIPSSLPLPSGMMPAEPPSPNAPRMMPFGPGGGGPGGFFSPGPVAGFLPHPFARLPGPPPPPPHHPLMPGSARPLLSPSLPKSEPLPPASPNKPSPRDTPKSSGEASRPPSRAEPGDYSAPSSHGSSDKPGSRASSPPPPPTSSSVPPMSSVRSKPGTPVSSSPSASSMAALSSPPIPPPLIPTHPSLPPHLPHHHPHHPPPPLSMSSPHHHHHHPLSRSSAPGPMFSHSLSVATPTSFPLPSPLTSFPAMMRGHGNPFLHAGGGPLGAMPPGGEGLFRNSILPTKTIDPSENLEQYMEIQKSETDKLQQLVENIPDKVREPNQCVICHRVLSCKSALQMHYRIHTGERPFKCKICSRKFTTKGNLKTHMGVHRSKSAVRVVHTCPVCNKVFTNVLVLQTHIRQQHGGLPPTHPLPHLPIFPHLSGWPGKAALPPAHHMMAPPPPPPPQPFDLSRHHGEPKELLDLSNKREPMFFGGEGDSKPLTSSSFHEDQEGRGSADEEDERMDEEAKKEEEALGEEEMEGSMDEEREEEAYNLSRDGGSNGPASQGPQSAYSDNGDSDRPDSAASNAYGGYDLNQPLPPNGDVMNTFLNPSHPPPRGVVNPSLAALEDHVNSLSASENQSGFERFRTSLGFGSGNFFMDKSMSPGLMMPLHNGGRDRSPVSPRSSEAGSDGSRDDSKFTPPEFSLGQLGFPMMGMDISRGLKSNTTCQTCFKTFPCKSALETHMRSHTKERPFQCDECQRAFSTRGNLKQHQLTHRPDQKGDFPNPPARDSGSENNEGDSGSGEGDSKPARESSPQPDKPPADSHTNAGSSSSPPTSSEPRPPTSSSSSSSSSSQEPLPAPQSQPPLPSASGNSNGDKPPTSSNNNNNNNNNNKSFPDGNSTKESSPHGDPDGALAVRRLKHVCNRCMKPFSSASALQIHMRTHTGDKPFKCTVCNKAFTTRGNLKVHMGTHMYHSTPSRRGRRMSIENPMFFSSNPYLAAAAGFPAVPPRPPPPHPADSYFSFQSLMNGMGPARPNEIPVIQNVNGALGHHLPMYPGFPAHPFSGLAVPGEEMSKHAADLSQARALGADSGVSDREGDRRREADREPSPSPKRLHERSPSTPPAPYPSSNSSSSSLLNGSLDNPAGTVTSTGELDLSMKPTSSSTPLSSPQEASARPPPPPSSPPRMSYSPSPALMTSSPANKPPGERAVTPPPPLPLVKDNGPDSVLCSPPPAQWVWNTLSCHRCGQNFPSRPALEQHIQTQHLNADTHPGGQPITA